MIDIFDDIRQSYGDIPIYIQRIGRRTSFSNTGGVQAIRQVQAEIIAENSWCYEAAETYDLELFDAVHLTDAAYLIAAERNALALLNQVGAYGPSVYSTNRVGTAITINLQHDAGTDFTPSSNIEGFRFFDDGVEISIMSAIKTDNTTVTLTLASTPNSVNQILYYGYDDIGALNPNNIIKDNAETPMPLRTTEIMID